ncbi:sugar ABC transporter substrate-binding protein [Mangrovibacillus cuniculi]|uniref:Sugar ABC transporter substrate-binding protein n=1 Tax=Mangrovibacillus cuniculi TaxID=2593652 RepID=A0A7S8HEM6_9BACI|nr:sugar ABC transporter substrate-binding protein [Mangrovibacillus cuniculi]QPC45651.1 sugar ABC transporter substrate-binding protein [Mangrovibacillus cuniculi]
MKKIGIATFTLVFIFFGIVTLQTLDKVRKTNWELPTPTITEEETLRFVMITQDLETPFWDKVATGAKQAAEELTISLEVWGSYGNQQETFLKQIEIAIHGKVDGIIVQGSDTDKFKELTKVKASFYGIPIVTVANDVPMQESLRKTYVGSDHQKAGKMIANQLVKDMGNQGEVILLYDTNKFDYQMKRIEGIQSVLEKYPSISVYHAKSEGSREQIQMTTQHMLNVYPKAKAYIAVNANMASPLVHEISKRYQVEPYYLYSFDDGAESTALLETGKLDAIIEQDPSMIGEISVEKLAEWVRGQSFPLDSEGYFTNIRVAKVKTNDE